MFYGIIDAMSFSFLFPPSVLLRTARFSFAHLLIELFFLWVYDFFVFWWDWDLNEGSCAC
jgi:hypothetical protein